MSDTSPSPENEQTLTDYEREVLARYGPLVTDGALLNERGRDRQIREADPALIADYAARLDALLAELETMRQRADQAERDLEVARVMDSSATAEQWEGAFYAERKRAGEDRRKVEAYDAARAVVKREGFSRAEYVLRAEAAEEALAAVRQERDKWERRYDLELARAQKAEGEAFTAERELAAVRQRETPDEGTEVRLSFAEAVHQIRDHLTRLSNAPHEEHFGPFCPICGLIGSLRQTMEDWRP